MEQNKIMNEKSAQIVRLDKENCSFNEKNGFLALKVNEPEGEKLYDRVFLHRAFPHEFLYQYISVLDDDKKEIGIIFDISDLTEESEALVKTEIDLKYYSPVIKDIKSVKERYGFSYWKVILDDGRSKDITMQDTFKNILHTGEDSLVLVDVDGNRFTVKSVSALSSRSYRKIELYL